MTFTGTLLPYQPEAVDRMCDRGSMLVAYDLGLGKTVLTIAAIERLMDEGSITQPGLVICLSSLKYQWAQQITKFTSGTSIPLVIDGTPKQRLEQYQRALNWEADYIILNYEQVVNDWNLIRKLPAGFIITDEATAIKSFKSKRSKLVKKLNSDYKFALTGTPVENGKPEELFSIMQFVDPKVLGRFDLFDNTFIVRNQFGGVERYRNLTVLNERLKTACVRKRQEDPDVAPHLPDTIFSEPMLVSLDKPGKDLYNRIRNELLAELDEALDSYGSAFDLFSHYGQSSDQGGQVDQLRGSIMSKLTALRMLCDHPDLLKESAKKFKEGRVTLEKGKTMSLPGANGGSSYAAELLIDGALDKLKKAPKLEALKSYVKDFLEEYENNKIVIFTSYVGMTEIIKAAMPYGSVTYTGQMNAKEKDAAKLLFQNDPKIRIFISSDAGGYGVDLPQANLLVNYDLPWNAGLAVQRNGRIRRASSKWSHVVIQDILIANSIEERQHAMLTQKKNVASAVLDGEGINEKGGISLTAGSLRGFLMDINI